MFIVEAVAAKHGDCLILHYGDPDFPTRILIDGGPPGTYNQHLKHRLRDLVTVDGPPEFELAMVSHVDSDHIAGLLDLTKKMIEDRGTPDNPAVIKRFWHNSFKDITGTEPAAMGTITASSDAGVFPEVAGSDGRGSHVLASIGQGSRLAANLVTLGLDRNRPFNDTLILQGKATEIEGMSFRILGPDVARLTALQTKWNPDLDPAEIAAFADRSISNLASMVILAEFGGKSILLTGDARGDDIMEWLGDAGLLEEGGPPFHVDILKMPHHGSDRNVAPEFFERVTAETYLYCANGHHNNPDAPTFAMMREARAGATYSVVLSNEIHMDSDERQAEVEAELAALADAGVEVITRADDVHFVQIPLLT